MGEAGKKTKSADALLQKDWKTVSGFLREHPDFIRNDDELLADLNLRIRTENVVDFGPAALARLSRAKTEEETARIELERTAQSNFHAQAQCHAAAIDILESRNNSDLARRLDEIAQLRFGLVSGVIAIEAPGSVPAGWRPLEEGMTDVIIGDGRLARMGATEFAETLFWQQAEVVKSVAMVRIALCNPMRMGLVAFGASDPEAFTPSMGAELVAFLARVIERTAERWPVL
jgi:uncharacterized protein